MKNYTAKIALFGLIAAGLAVPVIIRAQDTGTNAPQAAAAPETSASPEAPAPVKHKKHGLPFHGTLDSVDTNAMTLTVGSRTFEITSMTRIKKDGQPAILADGVVGQPVSGSYRTNDDGTLDAVSVYFGQHAKKKKKESSDDTVSTNAPASN